VKPSRFFWPLFSSTARSGRYLAGFRGLATNLRICRISWSASDNFVSGFSSISQLSSNNASLLTRLFFSIVRSGHPHRCSAEEWVWIGTRYKIERANVRGDFQCCFFPPKPKVAPIGLKRIPSHSPDYHSKCTAKRGTRLHSSQRRYGLAEPAGSSESRIERQMRVPRAPAARETFAELIASSPSTRIILGTVYGKPK